MANEKDPFQDIANQFKEMRQSLDKIAESSEQMAKDSEPVAKVAKKQISHDHRPNAPTPRVDLDKNTKKDILAALKNIRNQIVVSQHRENTMSDVAADALASGQSLAGAAKEALSFKKEKLKASFKRKFDPLNIIHRITGGSKLATALAGRAMGRSEQSIRSSAGLQPQMETPMPFLGGPSAETPSPVSSDKATSLLESMSGTLSQILDRLTDLTLSNKEIQETAEEDNKIADRQATTLERMRDEAKDTQALGAVHEAEVPMQIDKDGKPVVKEESSLGGMFKKLLRSLFTPLGLVIVGLVASAIALYKQWENIKLSVSLLKDSIFSLWDSIKNGVGQMKDWVSDFFVSIYDTILDASDSLVEGVVTILNKLPGVNIEVPTTEQKNENLKKAAAAGDARAQRKLAKQVAPASEADSVLKKLAPGFASKLSKDTSGEGLEALRKGELIEPAIQGLQGVKAPGGTPNQVAATGALSQMVASAYGELYKDPSGKPLRPSQDKSPMAAERLQTLTQQASSYLADAATSTPSASATPTMGIPTTITPTEVPMPAPQTGQILSQANELQRSAAMAPEVQGSSGGNTIINNVKNNNTSSSTVHQNMSPARSEESSYLRSLDRGFAPA